MPASKKPRKKYRPKVPAHTVASANAQAMLLRSRDDRPLDAAMKREAQTAIHMARAAIERGMGTPEDVDAIALSSNIAMRLAEKGVGPELLPQVIEAQHHIVELMARHQRGQPMLLTGPGIKSVRTMLDILDAQLELPELTRGLMYGVMADVIESMAIGNVYEITP
jgi:hypothetical protein